MLIVIKYLFFLLVFHYFYVFESYRNKYREWSFICLLILKCLQQPGLDKAGVSELSVSLTCEW